MISKRPSVFIYTFRANGEILKEVCAGLEEEGVFSEITEQNELSAEELARAAANDSMLGCGIGIAEYAAVLTIKGLPPQKCVERLEFPSKMQSRILGANSARAVKKQAFRE